MEDLSELLKPLLDDNDVPSVAAAVVYGSEIHAAGAVGVRKRGDETPVTVNDKYHVGSCTKAMTATLAGVLVERGVLSWETQLREVFPDIKIHSDYRNITLKQLLTHTGGFPTDPHDELWEAMWQAEGPPHEQREKLVVPGLLSRSPEREGGSFSYSNAGYTVAGAVLERVTRTPFEMLLSREYFERLQMTSAGFGAPATQGKTDQPYGHNPDPVDPEPYGDNPPSTAPAGTVHMSILDFAKHAAFHLTGKPGLVSPETLRHLHTPNQEGYAFGWRVSEKPWAEGDWLMHNGSNTMFLAYVGFAPETGKALMYATNLGTQDGIAVVVKVFKELADRYLDN